jgi:aryl-alcohol dehydrogenase-like predicted oxidoreductase
MEKSIKGSLNYLNLDVIPICLLHSVSAQDMMVNDGMLINCLLGLKEAGLARKVGATVYTPEDVRAFLSFEEMDAIQVPINILDHRLITTGLLDELRSREIIVFARSIFLQGLFFLNPRELPSGMRACRPYLIELKEISKKANMSIAQLAFRFVRDLPGITSLVLGVETTEQLKENLSLLNTNSLPDEIQQEILEKFKDIEEEIINPSKWDKSG